MLRPRIIPCLLVHQRGLFKTVGFKNPKYVGDPINAVKIFNEKETDELIVLDIDATINNTEPDFKLITYLASECRMPLCYGGGVKTNAQIKKIISLGVEKVAISSAAIENPMLIKNASAKVGNQSLVVIIDVKKRFPSNKYEVYTHRGRKRTGRNPLELAVQMEKFGAGEIVINSIINDGAMKGYDLKLMRQIRNAVNVPVTALGGAGSLQDISKVISECDVSGAAVGSLFVFKGAYKAVLINYPETTEKDALIGNKLTNRKI
jgi:imidazole glycerol-phosphate synthase subunit HisF